MLESFSSHLFVRQVNMFILNLCLTFHSLSVLFICFINQSILCKLVLYIHFCLMKIQHIQSQYGSQIAPQWRLDELLFAVRTQVPRVTISGLSWACLGRWYGFLNFALMFYYDICNEWRGIKYTYISILYNNCLK